MARVLLVSTNTTTDPYPVFPLGMSVVASALREAGHHVRQFDYLMSGKDLANLEAAVNAFDPDMTGISLRNIDNVDSLSETDNWYLGGVREATVRLKSLGQTVIVGGPGYSLMPEDILDYLGADYGVVGEGERKIVSLVAMLEGGQQPPRIMKKEKGLGAGEMKTPYRDAAMAAYYLEQSGIMNIQTKRGCENRCSYCSYPYLEGGVLRVRETADVIEEIESLHRECSATEFFFTDSVFNDSRGYYLEIAEALARRALPVKWNAFFQPTRITVEELRLLKRSGLHAMELGTDAASDETLTALNKGFSFDDVARFNEVCVSERVPCAHFVIFGGPGETPDTAAKGIRDLNNLPHCVIFPFSGIRLYKGTPLYTQAVREGVIAPEDSLLYPRYYFSPHIAPDTLNQMLDKGFRGRRDRIFPPENGQERLNVLHRFGYRGILWDTLIKFPAPQSDRKARGRSCQHA